MKLDMALGRIAALLIVAAPFAMARRRASIFCEHTNEVQWASGEVWPCVDVSDAYDDQYDCELYSYVPCGDIYDPSDPNFPDDCDGFEAHYDGFQWVDTYLVNCDYHEDQWAGICYKDYYGDWYYTEAYCDRGHEAIISVVQDTQRRLGEKDKKDKKDKTFNGRGPPKPVGRVPSTTEVEIDGKTVMILDARV